MTPSDFYQRALVYCAKLNASQTSGYRTVLRNQAVGGHPDSKHMLGLAIDVVYDMEVARERRETTARQLGLKLVIEDTHDHLSVHS